MSSNLNHILANKDLLEELLDYVKSDEAGPGFAAAGVPQTSAREAMEGVALGRESSLDPVVEAIVLKHGRPVLFIQDNVIEEPTLSFWKDRLATARTVLEKVIPSVGRIELRGHPRFTWVGTGWLIAPRLVLTNRHVAQEFAREKDGEFTFKTDPIGKSMRAWIDFYQEHERPSESEFKVKEVVHVESDDAASPDIAFLRVTSKDDDDRDLPTPIVLSEEDAGPDAVVGAVGYAAWDGNRNDKQVMDDIFGGVYDVKRLHPGEVMAVHERFLNHDCSTLGGNSGSVVLDFKTGTAVGLHYAGRYERQNYAVKATTVRKKLEELSIDVTEGL